MFILNFKISVRSSQFFAKILNNLSIKFKEMGLNSNDLWYLNVLEEFETFNKCLDEKIDKEQQQLKASKKKTELETKLAQELKLHNELTDRLAQLSRRGTELDRVCSTFEHLTIADSDQNRLDSAKETLQLAKELTSVRIDFRSAATLTKGYIKSESRKLLQPFEFPAADSGALWDLIHTTAAPGWPDKENQRNN